MCAFPPYIIGVSHDRVSSFVHQTKPQKFEGSNNNQTTALLFSCATMTGLFFLYLCQYFTTTSLEDNQTKPCFSSVRDHLRES